MQYKVPSSWVWKFVWIDDRAKYRFADATTSAGATSPPTNCIYIAFSRNGFGPIHHLRGKAICIRAIDLVLQGKSDDEDCR